jgi:hypothetical protein
LMHFARHDGCIAQKSVARHVVARRRNGNVGGVFCNRGESTMSNKFEIDQLEERIAPSTLGISGFSLGVAGNDGVTVGLPLLGNISVGVNANDTVSFSGVSATLPSLGSLL